MEFSGVAASSLLCYAGCFADFSYTATDLCGGADSQFDGDIATGFCGGADSKFDGDTANLLVAVFYGCTTDFRSPTCCLSTFHSLQLYFGDVAAAIASSGLCLLLLLSLNAVVVTRCCWRC